MGNQNELNRRAPVAVRRKLRAEVGFGCPIERCGSPYLEYHHFDPPWAKGPHHNPEGMLALCATHHAQADHFTVEDCRELKRIDPSRPDLSGRFSWMREDILAIVGGSYFYEVEQIILFEGQPVIWFQRDERRRLLLNMRSLVLNPLTGRLEFASRRVTLVDNDWVFRSLPADIESPPNASRLEIRYPDGDHTKIHFREWQSPTKLVKAHPNLDPFASDFKFPLTTAEVYLEVVAAGLRFTPRETSIYTNTMTGGLIKNAKTGIAFWR